MTEEQGYISSPAYLVLKMPIELNDLPFIFRTSLDYIIYIDVDNYEFVVIKDRKEGLTGTFDGSLLDDFYIDRGIGRV